MKFFGKFGRKRARLKVFNKFLRQQKEKLEAVIAERQKIANDYLHKIEESQKTFQSLQEQIKLNRQIALKKQQEIESYQKEIKSYQGIVEMEELGLEYTPAFNDLDEITTKKESIQKEIADLIANDKAILTTRIYRIDNSETKGRKFQKAFCENLLIGFNSYFNKKKKSITAYNFNNSIYLIQSKFDKMNQKASLMGVSINSEYLNLILDLLQLELDEKITKNEERERIKEERRRLKEQEKLLAEAEKAKLELQKQRRMYEQSLAKALTEQERQEFEAKLKEIDKREADVDYRINNSRAGYLYITATKAMPNMVKIGVTRRLNPLVRIQELSSAATPYPFKCYGLVFSDDAFELETRIHEYFDNKRVNKENKHKEFFYITPQEVIKVLKEDFGCDVHFVNKEESEDEEC